MEPPPSRYRVIERKGRLEVTDTWAARHPSPPRTHAAAPVEHFSDLVIEQPVAEPASAPVAEIEPMPDFAPADPAWSVSPPPTAYESTDFMRAVATAVCGDERDDQGRLILVTKKNYDSKAPRRIALDVAGEREVGRAMLILLAVVVSAIVFAVSVGFIGFVIFAFVAAFSSVVRSITTPWLDRIEARTR